jgi:hypothetical protein
MISVPSSVGTPVPPADPTGPQSGGRKKNSWLAHVKATMRGHRNKSFKQVLKIAKKTYKKKSRSKRESQSQSQSRSSQSQSRSSQNQNGGRKKQRGGSGVGGGREGMTKFSEDAAPVA